MCRHELEIGHKSDAAHRRLADLADAVRLIVMDVLTTHYGVDADFAAKVVNRHSVSIDVHTRSRRAGAPGCGLIFVEPEGGVHPDSVASAARFEVRLNPLIDHAIARWPKEP